MAVRCWSAMAKENSGPRPVNPQFPNAFDGHLRRVAIRPSLTARHVARGADRRRQRSQRQPESRRAPGRTQAGLTVPIHLPTREPLTRVRAHDRRTFPPPGRRYSAGDDLRGVVAAAVRRVLGRLVAAARGRALPPVVPRATCFCARSKSRWSAFVSFPVSRRAFATKHPQIAVEIASAVAHITLGVLAQLRQCLLRGLKRSAKPLERRGLLERL